MTSPSTSDASSPPTGWDFAAAKLGEELGRAPFALAMSSGFFAFFAHTGFLIALEEAGLRPRRVSGSSAGALVGAAWAAGADGPILAEELEGLERRHFWDPSIGPGLLRGRLFRERMERLLPVRTFEETRVPAAVSVFDVRRRLTEVITRGPIAPAICASCAVPFLFQPVKIAGRRYFDGGILDRPGVLGMPADEPRVLFHHIASRSPWRLRAWGHAPASVFDGLPIGQNLLTLALSALPRSGPFRLEAGRRALVVAKEAMKRALDRPVSGPRIEIPT